jgi:hypothetical protein
VHSLLAFARIEFEVFLVALALVVAFQLLTGKINMGGLLQEKTGYAPRSGVNNYSPARLQMLLVTLAGAFYLISQVINNVHNGKPEFPTLDSRVFLLLGGSHSVYLGGKLNSLFGLFGKSDNSANSPKGDQP